MYMYMYNNEETVYLQIRRNGKMSIPSDAD